MFDDSNLISNLNQTNIEHDISEVKNSRERKLEKDIIQKLVNPEDKFGLPPMSLDEGEDDVCKTDVWEKVPKAPLSSKTTVIIDGIFIINTSPLASHQTFGDYAGGFDDDRKDRAISILNGQVVDYDLASANHEEADTRVWLHASVTTADQVIIYSPDTDVFFIAIREKLWERVVTEVEMMPNHEALKLHWMRCCWVFDNGSQSTSNTHTLSDLSKSG
ncbi:unnamed protein product [Mytilus coruscus]|uniref:Uncharacterized protein n=1 Tax=Mytilus coruscus TaxID=42192 RepID=A0A6J8DBP1_MYTCO|nr:unnamed protein product [Mytilus coruscus]